MAPTAGTDAGGYRRTFTVRVESLKELYQRGARPDKDRSGQLTGWRVVMALKNSWAMRVIPWLLGCT